MSFKTNRQTHKIFRITDKITVRQRIEMEQDRLASPFNTTTEKQKIEKMIKQLQRLSPERIVNVVGEIPKE